MLIRAYIKSGKWEELDAALKRLAGSPDEIDTERMYRRASLDAYLEDETGRAKKYAQLQLDTQDGVTGFTGLAHYVLGDLEMAKDAWSQRFRRDSAHRESLSSLAGIHLLEGSREKGEMYLQLFDTLEDDYQYGELDYWRARAYAMGGDDEKAYELLEKAVRQGYWNNFFQFQYDIVFKDKKDEQRFLEIQNYWH